MSFVPPTVMRSRASRAACAMLILASLAASGCNGDPAAPEPAPSTVSQLAHAHASPDETCFICDPAKRDTGRLWCKEHGRYEDRCWECHPELRDPKRPYCEEHGLYEDECFLCDPSRAAAPAEGGETAEEPRSTELFCKEHQVPEHECGICQPDLAGTLPVGGSLLIRMASDRSGDLAGLATARPIREDATTSISMLGEVRFNGNRLAKVTPLSGGVLAKVDADLGETVEEGEVLAIVQAPGVAEARAAYLSAGADLELRRSAAKRQRGLFEDKIGSRREMEEAEAAYRRAQVATRLARQQILNLGFTESEVASMRDARSDLPVRAPFRGTVVKRSAVLGEAVEAGTTLFEIAALGEMWVDIAVPEEHAPRLAVGTPIHVAIRGLGEVNIEGRITWAGPVVDPRTRLVRARGVIPNEGGGLRDGMFADVRAIVGEHPGSMRLRTSSVHRIGDLPFVFVRKKPDLFAARRVQLGDRLSSEEIVILRGVGPDDEVVTEGSFVVKSALLASRLGAGCTDD
ncbi:MAG: efflux RND transporter periplasmic adaptor subunit [Myxococcales bacterium]|nr:efflux RND transporter periplasmic adaptor subunit [Myxococcales bacterium]